MPKRTNIIFTPKASEWIFNFIRNAPATAKQQLNALERSWLRTTTALKRFLNNSVLDRKLTLLTKLGLDWALVVFDPQKFDARHLAKVYRQHSIEGNVLEEVDEMVRKEYFVLSSRQVAISMSMASSNCHSDVFRINRDFVRIRESLRELSQIRGFSQHNQNKVFAAAEDAQLMMARMISFCMDIDDYCEAVLGITPLDLRILIILRQKPNNYFRVDYLQSRLKINYKPTTIAHRARILFETDYTDRLPTTSREPSYQIKAKGILALGDALNKLAEESTKEI